jgi:hypothetical protein
MKTTLIHEIMNTIQHWKSISRKLNNHVKSIKPQSMIQRTNTIMGNVKFTTIPVTIIIPVQESILVKEK